MDKKVYFEICKDGDIEVRRGYNKRIIDYLISLDGKNSYRIHGTGEYEIGGNNYLFIDKNNSIRYEYEKNIPADYKLMDIETINSNSISKKKFREMLKKMGIKEI